MTLSGGYMRKTSARAGTAAYWIEVFQEQVAREGEKRRAGGPAPAPEGPTAPPDGKAPQSS